MKACLRTTTILAGTVFAASAMAQTAGPKAPFTAYIDGDAQTYIGVQSGTRNNGTSQPVTAPAVNSHGRALGMLNNAEIRFTFEGKADNGLTYGWFGRMGGASDTITFNGWSIDREDLYFKDRNWGTLQLGNNSSAGKGGFPYTQCDYGPLENVSSLCPDGGSEQLLMSDPNALAMDGVLVHLGADGPLSRGRAMGLYYQSPNLNGLVFRADYGPDGQSRNEEQFVTTTSATAQTISTKSGSKMMNIATASAMYQWAAGDWSGIMGAGISTGQGKKIYTTLGEQQAISDMLGYFGGASVQWRDWRIAANYTWKGKSMQLENPTAAAPTGPVNVNHPTSWGYSLMLEQYSYAIYQPDDKGPTGGDWGYGFWYQYARDAGPFTSNGIWEINYFGLGGGYWIAPGLQVFTEAFYYNDYNTHPSSNNGGFVGTAANQRNPRGQIYFAGVSVEW
jgi:hypothetical protein